LVQPCSPRQRRNAPQASWMTCSMPERWFLTAGEMIPGASRIDCNLQHYISVVEVSSVVIRSTFPLVSLQWSRNALKCMASHAPVCWPSTCHPYFTFEHGKEQATNLMEIDMYMSQCPMSIHNVSNVRRYRHFVSWCPPVSS
jgi:hypothetical protein